MWRFEKFSEKQKKVLRWWTDDKYGAIICDGAVRSGKTTCMGLSFVMWAMMGFADTDFAICGKTVTSVKRNIADETVRYFKSCGLSVEYKTSRNLFTVSHRGRTNRFYLFGGKDEGSAALIQGMTLGGVLLDEVALMPRSFVEQAIARCSVQGARLWFNCNPEHPYHWFYREWICRAEEKNAFHLHFTMEDNPSLSPAIRRRYERLYTGTFYERFVLGKWAAADGLVYPMFSEKKHVTDILPVCDRFWISCDYGTVNPSSFGLWGHCAGVWYRMKEYYFDARKEGERRTDEEHYAALEELADDLPIESVIADPSAASFIACIRRHGRFRVIPADNDVTAGIQQVSQLLGENKLQFHRDCQDILREFHQYCWQDSLRGDIPKKEQDHAMDDMRYFVRTVICRHPEDSFFVLSARR